jgi:hypothetical protein
VEVAGIRVAVGRGIGLVGGATFTVTSHPTVMTMTAERIKKAFFTIVLCIAESPFTMNHI